MNIFLLIYFFDNCSFLDDCSNLLTAPTGSITSLGFPDSYPADRDCTWLISVSGNKKIALMFTQFDVYQGSIPQSCSDDFLEVRNGLTDISSQIGEETYCNNNRAMLMTSRQNVVRIYFHSGRTSHAHKGFHIHYLAVTQGILKRHFSNLKFLPIDVIVGIPAFWYRYNHRP